VNLIGPSGCVQRWRRLPIGSGEQLTQRFPDRGLRLAVEVSRLGWLGSAGSAGLVLLPSIQGLSDGGEVLEGNFVGVAAIFNPRFSAAPSDITIPSESLSHGFTMVPVRPPKSKSRGLAGMARTLSRLGAAAGLRTPLSIAKGGCPQARGRDLFSPSAPPKKQGLKNPATPPFPLGWRGLVFPLVPAQK